MTEIFYGQWTLQLVRVVAIISSRLTISGSAASDGTYELHHDQPLTLDVDGAQWRLDIESWFPQTEFSAWDTRRTTEFTDSAGLVVTVECGRRPLEGAIWYGPLYAYAQLRCVSRDPELQPEPAPLPFDFTVPEG